MNREGFMILAILEFSFTQLFPASDGTEISPPGEFRVFKGKGMHGGIF
jgi:hypothetical protein